MTPASSAQQGWIDFLGGWRWEWFCTFTFASPVHPERADKAFRWWVRKVNAQNYDGFALKRGDGMQWCRALEVQKKRGRLEASRPVIHYHALIRRTRKARFKPSIALWKDNFGFCKLEVIRKHEAVIGYCAKYLAKDGNLDVGGPGWLQGETAGGPEFQVLTSPEKPSRVVYVDLRAQRAANELASSEAASRGSQAVIVDRWPGGVYSAGCESVELPIPF